MNERFRRVALKVLIALSIATVAFTAGAVVVGLRAARSQGLDWFQRHMLRLVPTGKLGPGTYSIPMGPEGQHALCIVVPGRNGQGVREIDLVCGYPGKDFTFEWQRASPFGAPFVLMESGASGRTGGWFDVGVRGRILIGTQPNGKTCTRLNGKWVPWPGGKAAKPGQLVYRGNAYGYDRNTGQWKRIR